MILDSSCFLDNFHNYHRVARVLFPSLPQSGMQPFFHAKNPLYSLMAMEFNKHINGIHSPGYWLVYP